MKILLKYFSDDHISNVLIPTIHYFDRVVYLTDVNITVKQAKQIEDVIKTRNNAVIEILELARITYESVEEIIKRYKQDDCYIQIDGQGLLATYIHEAAIKLDITRIVIDVKENNIKVIGKDMMHKGHFTSLSLNLCQIVALSGAKIVSKHRNIDINDDQEFQKDIGLVFNIIKKGHKKWIYWMQELTREISQQKHIKGGLKLSKHLMDEQVFKRLREANIISVQHKKIYFKNNKIKSLFQDIGVWLEYYVYLQIHKSKEFNDYTIGAIIDYNGERNDYYEPICEIDVMAVRGLANLFISCKMNKVDAEAINEIKLHSLMFGNSKSKAVVVTLGNISKENPIIYQKAKELGVSIIDKEIILNGQLISSLLKVMNGEVLK